MSAGTRTSGPDPKGAIDVSDLETARVRRYARDADEVYFERRGGRTFLVTDGCV
jgi:hypothetical protein